MNLSALVATIVFASAFIAIYGLLYRGASRSYSRGEIDVGGIRILRWGLLGHLTIFLLLGITAFLT
jgi:hypothetical protein